VAKRPVKRTVKPKAGSGQKPVSFTPFGLHASLGVPKGKPIPAAKMRAALNGQHGPKAAAQARFAVNVLGTPKPSGTRTGAKKGASRGK